METNEQQIQILRANLLPLLQPKSSSSSSPTTSEYLLPGSSIHSNQLIIQSYGGQTLYMIDHVYIYKIQLSSPLSSSTYEFMPTKNPMIPFPFHCPSMIQSMECVFTHPDYFTSNTIRWSHIQHDQAHDRMACVDENGQLFLFEFTNNSHHHSHHHHDHNNNNNNTINENDDDEHDEKHDDEHEKQDNHKRTKRQRNENRIHPTLIYNINSSSSSTTTTTNQHANHGELGWCNVSFDAIDPNLIYIARHWYRDVIVLNIVKSTPTIVHVIHTSQRPTAIHAFPIQNTVNQKNNGSVASSLSSSYLAVAETNVVMIYHIGQSSSSSSSSSSSCDKSSIVIKCVTSVAKCRGTIYSITSDYKAHQQTKKHAHCLAVTGSDRTIYLFDTKKWAPRAKWQNAIKYSPSWIQMSSPSNSSAVDSASLVYVAGIDNSELKCGQSILNQSINKRSIGNNSNSIYADSRWLGLAHYQSPTSGQEMIVGLSQSGGLYVILNPNLSAIAAQ